MVFLVRLRKRVTYIQKFLARGSYRNNCFTTTRCDHGSVRATMVLDRYLFHNDRVLWDQDDILADVLRFQLWSQGFAPRTLDEATFLHHSFRNLQLRQLLVGTLKIT